ncbi:MAG: rhodanese-like domain-containing protein [Anaerolineae bacterium]|nr:rhodanese-like domain-containing protein [Anaerolineae bacterium]MDW8173398.1 rhodanese-like domain-containing protein [Anaerolineae bacterium]
MNFLRSMLSGGVESISAVDVQAALKDETSAPFLLDVRQPDEYQGGHISGAKLIPLDELSARLDELPKDRTIVCVCRSGARSSAAARQLVSAGYKALNLSGGMMSWEMNRLPIKKGK